MWHDAEGMGWWMIWGGIVMVLFWGLIVALVVWGVQSLAGGQMEGEGRPSPTGTDRAPLEFAKARYARGEIDADQFEEIRSRLESLEGPGKL